MTIKHPDCPMCRNRGSIYERRWNNEPLVQALSGPALPIKEMFETQEVACKCHWGQQWQIMQDRMRHPEYENPFLKMSDDEIIATLNKSSDDQRAIDAEFLE